MTIVYRMNDRYVEVQQPDGSWTRPMPSPREIEIFENGQTIGHAVSHGVWQWRFAALREEERTGVPANYQLATVFSESVPPGYPDNLSADGGTGLNAITATQLFKGHTRQEALDPDLNMQLAADFHAKNMSGAGFDIPKLASMFNGGSSGGQPHPNPNAPWGYNEYRHPTSGYTYISKVVRLANYAQDRLANCDDCGGTMVSSMTSIVGLSVIIGAFVAAAAVIGIHLGGKR